MSDEIKAVFVTTNTYDPFAHNNPDDTMPVTGAKNGMTPAQMRGKSYDDPDWEKLLEQLTVKEMTDLIALGGYQTIAVNSIGKLATTDCDGPASITNNFTGESSIGMPSP